MTAVKNPLPFKKVINLMAFFKKPDYITEQINLELAALIMACDAVGLSESEHKLYDISYGTDGGRKYLRVTNNQTGEKSGKYYY